MADKNIPVLVKDDPWLEPYKDEISDRIQRFNRLVDGINKAYGSLESFSDAYLYYGINYDKEKGGWWYREWAPAADALFFIGDFNGWDRTTHPMKKNKNGDWEIFLEKDLLVHEERVKVYVVYQGIGRDRIPAYIKRANQDPNTHDFTGQIWHPGKSFRWSDGKFKLGPIYEAPIIYEAHIGMSQEKEGVGSYLEFMENVLPRIKDLGYNTIQLMAIQEHPYYGSFGYHVSNFFAPTSRFGTPEELKTLVNEAHQQGLAIIIDIVHSHSVKNIAEGINEFDGSGDQYFHPGERGNHTLWDSKLFNYGKREVQRFLLSNIAYWIREFHVDGFRFDGVTSMLYFHHGDFTNFDHYNKYFVEGIEWDALTYLQLANELTHRLKKYAITIAEDMSGMPGLCRKQQEGGIGFDFRLGMGIPDFWIKYLKEKKDEDWNIHEMWHVMTNRRWKERTVTYAESHDQAIVGDKTIAFWLMDKEMYYHMQIEDQNLVIDRGIALHKLIRLFSISLGGEAYLNFIGNEFGHPEWIDFPREGNNWSYKYCRRQWSLVDNDKLKYKHLNQFDKDMIHAIRENKILQSDRGKQLNMDDTNKTLIYERNNLVFALNFHPGNSVPDYRFHAPEKGDYKIILCSDEGKYGGFDRVDMHITYSTFEMDNDHKLSIYLPNRTGIIMKKVK
ncbi:MAG: alpha amylase C-terminal domain-containing protein [Cyclobacteriaceae bacterium]|nr:alpha amylase C-terminal domain-containing protein [Cyclobacteriaceae bacterium]